MTQTRIKICGITRPEHARAAAAAGADAIGVVFYAPSPRAVSIAAAAEIADALPPFVTLVGLFVDPDVAEVEAALAQVPLGLLQFHGEEPPAFCEQFQRPYIKGLRVAPGSELRALAAGHRRASGVLLDAWVPGLPGGTGQSFDWSAVPGGLHRQLIVAGGLDAGNVGEAIRLLHPAAVDVSGGVERAPGEKDAQRMAGFVRAVRAADARCSESLQSTTVSES
jgi:phosphoribosylanthranilate isomerase